MILFIIFCALVALSRSDDFPSSIPRCVHGDKQCLINIMNEILKTSDDGVPDLNIVPTDPYKLQNVIVEKGAESPVNIKLHFKRANITGIHNIHVNKIIGFDKDPRTSKFEMHGHLIMANIHGPYVISGKVLLLPIAGRGTSDITFEKVKLRVSLKTHVETRDGRDYLTVDGATLNVECKKMIINLENLFNNKALSDSMNAILNENDQLIFKELQIPLEKVLEDVVKSIVAPVFEKFPYSDMFLID